MSQIPNTIDYDLAKIWLAQQNIADCSAQQIKEMFLNKLRELERTTNERWD